MFHIRLATYRYWQYNVEQCNVLFKNKPMTTDAIENQKHDLRSGSSPPQFPANRVTIKYNQDSPLFATKMICSYRL